MFLQSPAGGGSIFLVPEKDRGKGVVFLISFTEMGLKGGGVRAEIGGEKPSVLSSPTDPPFKLKNFHNEKKRLRH
jgi:hypothetical protein